MSNKLTVAEIDVNSIVTAGSQDLDLASGDVVYEHLLHFLSRFTILPSIKVRVENDTIFLSSRGVYLRVAKDLGVSRIRAVLSEQSSTESINSLVERKLVTLLDYDELRGTELKTLESWHVIFFQNELSVAEKDEFKHRILSLFTFPNNPRIPDRENTAVSHFEFSHSDTCAEFRSFTPVEDHVWGNQFWQLLYSFHNEKVGLATYQGRKFSLPNS